MAYEVSQLPPTLGIKDPEVKSFLDALVNAWDQRSGNIDYNDRNRFITKGEFADLANQAVLNLFAGNGDNGITINNGRGGLVADLIASLSDEIKKTYLYQLLGTEFDLIDVKALNARIDEAMGEAKILFSRERIERQSDSEAFTNQIDIQASRIDENYAAILNEATTRATKDSALASAINTIWASVGNNSALIQDGSLAAVTPSAVSATKWDQVQAAVTDPNTGQVTSTAIKEDLNSYINKTDGLLRSTWSVRVESQFGGRAIVGGVGLSLESNGSAGPTIDFGVRADRFWVGSINGQGNIPFIVKTYDSYVNGKLFPAGTYIQRGMIQEAEIDTAHIKDLSVDTIKIAGGAITSMSHAFGASGSVSAGGSVLGAAVGITMPSNASGVALIAFCNLIGTPNSGTARLEIQKNGSYLGHIGVSFTGGFQQTFTFSWFDPSPIAGYNVYTFNISSPTSGPGSNQPFNYVNVSLMATGGKR